MKLDIDCIRDVLIEFESFSYGNFSPTHLKNSVAKHGQEQVIYTLAKLIEAGFMVGDFYRDVNGFIHLEYVCDITFDGHEFLANIKPESTWEKLSKGFVQGGSASVKAAGSVALELGTELIKKAIGLNN